MSALVQVKSAIAAARVNTIVALCKQADRERYRRQSVEEIDCLRIAANAASTSAERLEAALKELPDLSA